jgi:hypothetical protein
LDTHSIFELTRLSGSSKYTADKYQSVLISEGENSASLKMGTPGIVLKHAFEECAAKDKIKILFPFPSVNIGMQPNYPFTIKRRHIIERKDNILDNHIVRNLQQLHLNDGLPNGAMQGNWKAIKRYVNTKGPITFRIKSHSNNLTSIATLNFLKDLKTLIDSYKYSSVTFHNSTDNYKSVGNMRYFVTFLGRRDCIPIFNPKRVDGVCVILTFISKAKVTNTLNPISNTTLLLSNYTDNAFVIDGTWVSIPEALHPDTLGRIVKLVKLNMIAKPKTKSSKKKKKLSTPPKYGSISAGAGAITSVVYSNSTSDHYYYSS